MARQPAKDQSKPLSRRVLVSIRRDQTTETPRVVWQHEIPILEAVFGEGNVRPVDPAVLDEGYTPKASPDMLIHNKRQDTIAPPSQTAALGYVFNGDPRAEYERLAAAYGKHQEQDATVVEYVYGRFQVGRFEQVVGAAELDDLPDAQLRSLILASGYLPEVNHTATEEDRRQVSAARAAFDRLGRDDLVKLADEIGVMAFA